MHPKNRKSNGGSQRKGCGTFLDSGVLDHSFSQLIVRDLNEAHRQDRLGNAMILL